MADIKTAPLLSELEESRMLFDQFIESEMRALQDLRDGSESIRADGLKEIDALNMQRTKLEAVLQEAQKGLLSKQEDVNKVLSEVQELKNTLETELPQKIQAKTEQVDREQENLNERKKEVDAKKEGRMLRKNELSKGVTFYKERLGLSFERMPDNSLSFRLTLIDPENPGRPFTFAVLVNSKNRYEVLRCEPRVDYEALLNNLNETNNFSSFVQQMRRLFKKMV